MSKQTVRRFEDAASACDNQSTALELAAAELDRLQADNAALREALQELVDDCLDLDEKGRAMVRDIHGWDTISRIRTTLNRSI